MEIPVFLFRHCEREHSPEHCSVHQDEARLARRVLDAREVPLRGALPVRSCVPREDEDREGDLPAAAVPRGKELSVPGPEFPSH